MLAVEWTNLGYAGTFLAGVLVGILVTIRLAKVLIDWLRANR